MQILNTATRNYRDLDAKITQEHIDTALDLIAHYQPVNLWYCRTIIPGAYARTKLCQWLDYTASTGLRIIDSRCKQGRHGDGPHWAIKVDSDDKIAQLKSNGWRLISKEDRRLVK